jgi:hypothetical protein
MGLMLTCSRIINGIHLPRDILESKELAAMSLCVNKLLILWGHFTLVCEEGWAAKLI